MNTNESERDQVDPEQVGRSIPPSINCENKVHSDKRSLDVMKQPSYFIGWLNSFWEPMTFVTLCLVIATLWLVYYTAVLVSDSKLSSEKQIRAYVFLKDIRFEKRNGGDFDVIPEWENTGNSETVDMISRINKDFSRTNLPDWFSDVDFQFTSVPIILGPRSVSNISFTTIDRDCLSQFNRRDDLKKFYLWGWVRYKDTLTKDKHFTHFCWDIDQVVFAEDGKSARLSHSLCAKGNCADKECPKPEPHAFEFPGGQCKHDQQ